MILRGLAILGRDIADAISDAASIGLVDMSVVEAIDWEIREGMEE